MIIVARYKILDGMAIIPTVKILEKHPNDYDFGFDINDHLAWFKYLVRKYMHLSEDKNGIPCAFRVYSYGGQGRQFYTFFPGTDEKTGKTKSLAFFGRLCHKPEHESYLRKC
jgi:hypothetical protein